MPTASSEIDGCTNDNNIIAIIVPTECPSTARKANEEDYPIKSLLDTPSNERLLSTAFCTFLIFALTQFTFAFIAHSSAMIGDSSAMLVDSLTYFFNYIAEVRKNKLCCECQRERRKQVLQLEIIPPMISMITLLVVTGIILHDAIHTLLFPSHDNSKNPNLEMMLGFSMGNLAIDFFNMGCFARARHLLGFRTTNDNPESDTETEPTVDEEESVEERRSNLNMCSAYTHVFADTLRSLAVIIAVAVAKLVHGIPSEIADAVAAIVVSGLILMSLLPLVKGMGQRILELRAIFAEERANKVLGSSGKLEQPVDIEEDLDP